MQEVDYESSTYPVRDDLIAAQRVAWKRIAEPGAFLSGARRVAVAREVRNALSCTLCKRRKEALSPCAIDGKHDHLGKLGQAETDVVHRITTDPGRLSRDWYDSVTATGLSDCEYIEIVSIIAVVKVLDTFRQALDLAAFELPQPLAGTPSGYSAPGAKEADGWVRLVMPGNALPSDGLLYDMPIEPPVVRALSLVPDAKRHFWEMANAHYLPSNEISNFTTEIRAINRMQMELIAARVSSIHQCVY